MRSLEESAELRRVISSGSGVIFLQCCLALFHSRLLMVAPKASGILSFCVLPDICFFLLFKALSLLHLILKMEANDFLFF